MRVKDQERLYRGANCKDADPNMFFPGEVGDALDSAQRKAIAHVCGPCTVRSLCAQMGTEVTGFGRVGRWGGSTRSLKASNSIPSR